ncbi:MAG TPA: aldehyde dehydrogenase family protein, partial [Alphaproteobacteria bacterium]|nr:aldehyde dehydrogenase family protein [Alphaproteobacteria bacterium]
GVFQFVHMNHETAAQVIQDPRISYVNFTGSVRGGRQVHAAAGERFIAVGLEMGGKDPAYVRPDAVFEKTVANLVDGTYYNAGQSCCAVERIYVHADLYDRFVETFVALVRRYRLGNPLDQKTDLGPLVRREAAQFVRQQVAEAVAKGAKALIDPREFEADAEGTPYMAPQALVEVDHSMSIMREETFGPAVGIMRVASDEEAIRLMNDSPYGLTASIWTEDSAAARRIGDRIETGTVLMNACDTLDPALAWVGVKDSGLLCGLSRLGYEHLTRPKSFNLRRLA